MFAKIRCSSKTIRTTCATARPSRSTCNCAKVVNGSKRIVSLEKKADMIRNMALTCKDPFDEEELMEALAKVKVDIKKIVDDPLTNDFCKDTPWSLECKVFDV